MLNFVVFDLDGTLIDSRRDLADSANEMLAGYGAPPLREEAVGSMVGSGAAQLVARALAASNVDAPIDEALARFLGSYDRRLTSHTRPYDRIPELLAELQGERVALALLTNKPLQQSVRILETFGLLGYFRQIVGGDGPLPRKPAPDGLLHLVREQSVGPSDTMLVGDSSVDLQTARNAGVRLCLARYGFGFADLRADALSDEDWIVDRPSDIAAAIRGSARSAVP